MRLPFPNYLLNTECTVTLNQQGLSEQGEPLSDVIWSGKVIFSEKSRTSMTADNRLVRLEGQVIIKDDIAPSLEMISDGEVQVKGRVYRIYRSERAKNPDGSVHHTVLELM